MADSLRVFSEPVRTWFRAALGEPTKAQALAWPVLAARESALLMAPTGSGKTLAAFLAVLDALSQSPEPPKKARCKVLYVSPLKALAVDIERNLRAPLAGIAATAARLGARVRVPTAEVRTGDTPQKIRTRIAKEPPDVLITTPESLYLMLTGNAREVLASVDTVIVDEIHSLVPTKRGAHLFLSLERLEELRRRGPGGQERGPLQRIGLSATQRPLDEVARLLGGLEDGTPRPVRILDAHEKKPLEIVVRMPKGAVHPEEAPLDPIPSGSAVFGPKPTSIWPEIHALILERMKGARTTMIFVNSRRLAERLAAALNELEDREVALAHHGSVAREKRAEIEDRLKRGELPAIVATSSLELGIDVGSVDLVIQIEAPPSAASGLQRIGRACHQVGGTPRGVVIPKHRGDLLAAAATTVRMRQGLVEETFYPRNPLDVLAQQIVAIVAEQEIGTDALYTLIRRAAPFAELPLTAYEGVLDMLSGRYPSDEFAELRARITWDRVGNVLRPREGSKRLAITSGGTIPDRGLYGVFLADGDAGKRGGKRVGELDEEMVFELREGEVFLLGATAWRAVEITHDRVLVSPAAGEQGKMPFWHGDRAGRPKELGAAIGELVRKVAAVKPREAEKLLVHEHDLDAETASLLQGYVSEQKEATAEVPSDRTLVVERFVDEIGDWRVCVLSPFGARVHAPWATAVQARLRAQKPGEIDVVYNDDGMAFRLPASDEAPETSLFLPPSDEVEGLVTASVADTSLFASRFRECAGRALLLPRRNPSKRTPLWAQRKRAADLLAVASRHPSFPIVLETYREVLRDAFDVPGLVDLLRRVEQRRIRVATVDTKVPSPFASTLLYSFVGNFMYDGDAPLAERRLAALTIDYAQLRELLGEAELRELLDAETLEEHERWLQRLEHGAKSADGVHDLLLLLGDLTGDEIAARTEPGADAGAWITKLEGERRIARVPIAGEPRYIAVEDAGRYRDALGVMPPRGLPGAFLEPVPDALDGLVRRYARTHGPFPVEAIAKRYGLALPSAEQVVARLVRGGHLVEGAFLAHGRGRELCDAEVLRALRRKSLAKLRKTVEPVDDATYGRLLVEWQGVTRKRRGPEGLLAALGPLEGVPIPASVLETDVLPARVEGYQPWDLDALCASGEVVWAGIEPLGSNDGRIALYRADHEALLARVSEPVPGEMAERIRQVLARRGAVFFAELTRTLGGYPQEILDALWSLVWAGEVTNDTLEPLRSLMRASGNTRNRRPTARSVRSGPPGSEGRWSLRSARWPDLPTETQRRTALARSLLDRYGILLREAVHAEGITGGFSAVYEVLRQMEEAGRVRRGYFLAGRGGAQFAAPGADERLRLLRDTSEDTAPLLLAAVDPANPYGAALPWPGSSDAAPDGNVARPQRAAGARVVLHEGHMIAYVGRGEDAVTTFLPETEPDRTHGARALVQGLASLVRGSRRALLLATIDGQDAAAHALAPYFREAGFLPSSTRLLLRRRGPGPADDDDVVDGGAEDGNTWVP